MPMPRASGGTTRPGSLTTRPESEIVPARTGSKPARQRRTVVLPQPDGPSRHPMSPAASENDMPRTTGCASYACSSPTTSTEAARPTGRPEVAAPPFGGRRSEIASGGRFTATSLHGGRNAPGHVQLRGAAAFLELLELRGDARADPALRVRRRRQALGALALLDVRARHFERGGERLRRGHSFLEERLAEERRVAVGP